MRARRQMSDGGARQVAGEPGARPLPIPHDEVDGQGCEETDEDVEESDAGLGDGRTVDSEQEPGEPGQEGRAGQTHGQPGQQHDGGHARQGGHESPTE